MLQGIINKGSHTTQTFRAAYILLNCDEGKCFQKVTNEQLAQVLRIGMRTIDRVKKRFVEEGLDVVLDRKPTTRVYNRKVDGDLEANIVSLCCSAPPKGYSKWTLRLIADKLVELEYVDKISHVTVGNILKKTNLSLGK